MIEAALETASEQRGLPEGPLWACVGCGEASDSGLTICWNCQSVRKSVDWSPERATQSAVGADT